MIKIKKYIITPFIVLTIFSILFINIIPTKATEDPYILDLLDTTSKFRDSAGFQESEKTPEQITLSVIGIVLALLGLGFLVLIIISGIQWMTSGGNEEKISTARKNIINATIGLAIVLLSYVISSFIFENIQKAAEDPYFYL